MPESPHDDSPEDGKSVTRGETASIRAFFQRYAGPIRTAEFALAVAAALVALGAGGDMFVVVIALSVALFFSFLGLAGSHLSSWKQVWGATTLVALVLLGMGDVLYWHFHDLSDLVPKNASNIMTNYGFDGPVTFTISRNGEVLATDPPNPHSYIVADGRLLSHIDHKKYKLMGVAFKWEPGTERMDAGDLSKSSILDIRDEDIHFIIYWTQKLIKQYSRLRGTEFALLAIPDSLHSFDTLRQAVAGGAIILEERGGPP